MLQKIFVLFGILSWCTTAFGAVSSTNLTNGFGASASSGTTASITRGTNELILLSVCNTTTDSGANTTPTTPTGFTSVASVDSSGNMRTTVFRYLGSSTTGTISIAFGGTSQAYFTWSVDSFTGIDTTGTNGSGAISQSVTGTYSATTTPSINLTSPSSSNGGYGASCGSDSAVPITYSEGTGYSAGSFGQDNMGVEWRADAQTTVDFSIGSSSSGSIIGIEIKAAAAGGATPSRLMLLGVGQ